MNGMNSKTSLSFFLTSLISNSFSEYRVFKSLKSFKDKFNLPVTDEQLENPPYLKFKKDSKETF